MAKPKSAGGRRPRKRERKNVGYGVAHIKSSFNNTIISFTDQDGNVLSWASAGNVGFKGSRKSTPRRADGRRGRARRAMEHGVRKVDVQVKGPGSGRETAIRSIQNTGIEVTGIKDVTPVPTTAAARPSGGVSEVTRMSRYTGPKARVSRRLGVNIWGTSGENRASSAGPTRRASTAATAAATPPSTSSSCRRSRRPASPTASTSGSSATSTRRRAAAGASPARSCSSSSSAGSTTSCTAGWASTRPQARQFVNHGHVDVNGRRVDIASYRGPQGRRDQPAGQVPPDDPDPVEP